VREDQLSKVCLGYSDSHMAVPVPFTLALSFANPVAGRMVGIVWRK